MQGWLTRSLARIYCLTQTQIQPDEVIDVFIRINICLQPVIHTLVLPSFLSSVRLRAEKPRRCSMPHVSHLLLCPSRRRRRLLVVALQAPLGVRQSRSSPYVVELKYVPYSVDNDANRKG